MAEKSKVLEEIDPKTKEYYDAVRELLSRVEQYAECYWLRENLLDEETWYAFIDELEEYYAGDMERLSEEMNLRHDKCIGTILRINSLCRKNGVIEIKKYDRLISLLVVTKRRKFWEKMIDEKMRKDIIVSLWSIERRYEDTL